MYIIVPFNLFPIWVICTTICVLMVKSKMIDIIALIVVFVAFAMPLAIGLVGAAPGEGLQQSMLRFLESGC